jgi:PqqD family protein of HPr-rel-A system
MYKVSEVVRSTHGQDGGVVFDIRSGRILRLNPVGSVIFQRLERGQAESQIVEEISHDFNICQTAVQKDISEFLQSLEQLGLVYRNSCGRPL